MLFKMFVTAVAPRSFRSKHVSWLCVLALLGASVAPGCAASTPEDAAEENVEKLVGNPGAAAPLLFQAKTAAPQALPVAFKWTAAIGSAAAVLGLSAAAVAIWEAAVLRPVIRAFRLAVYSQNIRRLAWLSLARATIKLDKASLQRYLTRLKALPKFKTSELMIHQLNAQFGNSADLIWSEHAEYKQLNLEQFVATMQMLAFMAENAKPTRRDSTDVGPLVTGLSAADTYAVYHDVPPISEGMRDAMIQNAGYGSGNCKFSKTSSPRALQAALACIANLPHRPALDARIRRVRGDGSALVIVIDKILSGVPWSTAEINGVDEAQRQKIADFLNRPNVCAMIENDCPEVLKME